MYADSKRNRTLLKDGRSVVSPFQAARMILNGEEITNVLRSDDVDKYETMYGVYVSSDIGEVDIPPPCHEHSNDDFDFVTSRIMNSSRWDDGNIDRVEKELSFFVESKNILFLVQLIHLIDKFKKEGIVWGVGRGSASASYILYLLEVHDVNPIKYDIPFSEMSKQQESKYDN
jgi:hypothetical protein